MKVLMLARVQVDFLADNLIFLTAWLDWQVEKQVLSPILLSPVFFSMPPEKLFWSIGQVDFDLGKLILVVKSESVYN